MRENYTNEGYIKEFNNHNINLRITNDQTNISDIEKLSFLLDSLDCYFIGEEFCLSNYDMGIMIYNSYSDKCYIIAFSEIEKAQEKTIKLHAFEPGEEERAAINEFLG